MKTLKEYLRSAQITVLPLLLAIGGCGGGSSPASIGVNPPPGGSTQKVPQMATSQYQSLQFTLSSDDSVYFRDDPVHLTYTVTNAGTTAVPYGSQIADVQASMTQNGQLVFHYQSGPFSETMNDTLLPGQTLTYPIVWAGVDQQGNVVPAGQYSIQAWWTPDGATVGGSNLLPSQDQALFSAGPLNITVQPGSVFARA